jgi:hypothetical protein
MKALIFVFLALTAVAQTAPYPFADYPVSSIYRGQTAAPQLQSKWAKTYRTMIRDGVKDEGVNFAGHYSLVIWGCGSSCMSFAIVDVITGQVFDPPFEAISTLESGNAYEGLVFKKNSRLLVASGCPNEKNCGVRYYRWENQQLKLVNVVAAALRG